MDEFTEGDSQINSETPEQVALVGKPADSRGPKDGTGKSTNWRSRVNTIKILFILFLFTILATALIYLYGPYLKNLEQQQTSPTPTPAFSPKVTALPTLIPTSSLTPTPLPTVAAEELSEFYAEPTVAVTNESSNLESVEGSFDQAETSDLDQAPNLDLEL